MRPIDRRKLFKLATFFSAAPFLRAQANERVNYSDFKKDVPIAAAYHCDYGNPERFSQTLTNMSNHLSVYNNDPFKIKVVVVAHAQGVKFFLKDLDGLPPAWTADQFDREQIFGRIKQLASLGAEFYMCQITFARNNIPPEKLREDSFLKWVPSGIAAVAELQNIGYAYVKVG